MWYCRGTYITSGGWGYAPQGKFESLDKIRVRVSLSILGNL